MERTVFYSWQSDTEEKLNHYFIRDALERAVRAIQRDALIEVAPRLDHDTKDVPGSPDIVDTILEKIDRSDVFVCDLSIVDRGAGGEPTPNPNVLIELGYAIKALELDCVIMVMNRAYGGPELLPFNLRTKRQLQYELLPDQPKTQGRSDLAEQLERALRLVFTELDRRQQAEQPQSLSIGRQACEAIETAQPNRVLLVRRFMEWLTNELSALAPPYNATGEELDELLVQALAKTPNLVVDFAHVSQTIALMNDAEAAVDLYNNFGHILKHYHHPPGVSSFPTVDCDFYIFIGHELFVTFFSFLIHEKRWELIANLLERMIYTENADGRKAGVVPFTHVSDEVGYLKQRNNRLQLRRASLHADLLNERHTQGKLGELVPMQQFMDADYFLFLRGALQPVEGSDFIEWSSWSTLYMRRQSPQYLVEASNRRFAEQLLLPLGLGNVEMLRARLKERAPKLRRLFDTLGRSHPLEDFNIEAIGSR